MCTDKSPGWERGVARGEHVWAGGEAESEGHGIRRGDGEGEGWGARQGNVRYWDQRIRSCKAGLIRMLLKAKPISLLKCFEQHSSPSGKGNSLPLQKSGTSRQTPEVFCAISSFRQPTPILEPFSLILLFKAGTSLHWWGMGKAGPQRISFKLLMDASIAALNDIGPLGFALVYLIYYLLSLFFLSLFSRLSS